MYRATEAGEERSDGGRAPGQQQHQVDLRRLRSPRRRTWRSCCRDLGRPVRLLQIEVPVGRVLSRDELGGGAAAVPAAVERLHAHWLHVAVAPLDGGDVVVPGLHGI